MFSIICPAEAYKLSIMKSVNAFLVDNIFSFVVYL